MAYKVPSSKAYSAVAYAVATLRGQLQEVVAGQADPRRVQGALLGTSARQIAAAIGAHELDLSIDWNLHLSEDEKAMIRGEVGLPRTMA